MSYENQRMVVIRIIVSADLFNFDILKSIRVVCG